MSLPLTDDLGVVQVAVNGTPVYWNAGLGYDVTGALCITTTVSATDTYIGGKRRDAVGRLVVADPSIGGSPFNFNAGWPSDKNTGATIRQINQVPAATDPRVAGIAIGPRGGVYMAVGGAGAFSPLDLFANGEPGFWYDPSDLSTMFQDSAGTIPMQPVGTVADQPVGLILDKSKGLVRETTLITNGDFGAGSTGWTLELGTVSGGKLVCNDGSTYPSFATQTFTTEVGVYEVSFTVSDYVSGSVQVQTYIGGTYPVPFVSGNGTYTVLLNVLDTSYGFAVNGGLTGFVGNVDNVSLRKISGNHASQATSTARPVLSARVNLLTKTEDFSDAVWTKTAVQLGAIGGGEFSVIPTATSNTHGIEQAASPFNLPYVSWEVKASGYTFVALYDITQTGTYVVFDIVNGIKTGVSNSAITDIGGGWFRIEFKPFADNSNGAAWAPYLAVLPDGVTPPYDAWLANGTDGILARKPIVGTISGLPVPNPKPVYQRVNTDADYNAVGFPHYLKFDGVDDSLSTAAIDFTSTDKMTVWGGAQLGATPADQILGMLTASVTSNPGSWALRSATTNWRFDSKGTIVAQPLVAGAAIGTKAVLLGSGDIAGDRALVDRNLEVRSTITTDQGTGNFSNAPMYVGAQGGTAQFLNGNVYSLIVAGADYPPLEDLRAIEWVAEKMGATLRTPGSPINTVAPVVTGTPSTGNTLTCSQGTWTGAVSYAYQWYDNGTPIVGATTNTYALTDANKGWVMSCTVNATNPQGTTGAPSNVVDILMFPYSGSWIYTTPTTGATPAVNTISHADNTVNKLNVSTTNAAGQFVDFSQLRTGDVITINGFSFIVQATPVMYGSYASISINPTTQQPDATYTVTVTRP